MANNVQTAAEWQQVKDSAQAQQSVAKQAAVDAFNAQWLADIKFREAAQAQAAAGGLPFGQAYTNFKQARTELEAANVRKESTALALNQINATISNADKQIATAQAGQSNVNSTVQPAGSSTNANSSGDNTDVVVTPLTNQATGGTGTPTSVTTPDSIGSVTPLTNQATGGTGTPVSVTTPDSIGAVTPTPVQNTNSGTGTPVSVTTPDANGVVVTPVPDQTPRIVSITVPDSSNPIPRVVVDDGTGGFRGTAIADEEATSITISNGIVTKTQEFANTAVTPEEDPFEKLRLEAEAGLNEETPTEQAIIDNDPFERERLEAEARLNEEGPTSQDIIDAEEDPFERERLNAQLRSDEEGLTEQDVILDITDNGDGAAEGGNTVGNGLNEPPLDDGILRTPDGAIEGEGDANTGLTEPPVEDDGILRTPDGDIEGEGDANTGLTEPPNDDGAAEGGNTVGDAANAITRDEAEMVITAQKLPRLSAPKDWRVRISLGPGANYLYAAEDAGILSPLKDTDGVIFPYTPSIQVNYTAKYDTQSPTHSNYNIYNYQGSSVEGLTVTGEFTAQSVTEANYLLAVIHFFRSATKMFYGQDPQRGTPPPLLYLSGYGQYQFDNHPMVLTSFNYSLPQDVDYVDAYSTDDNSTTGMAINGVSLSEFVQPNRNTSPAQNMMSSLSRRISGKTPLEQGGKASLNSFKKSPDSVKSITRVPSKIAITLSLNTMITRRAINDHFSLKDYATGKLLRGSSKNNNGTGGGIW